MFHGPAHLVYATAAFASSIWHLTLFCQCSLKVKLLFRHIVPSSNLLRTLLPRMPLLPLVPYAAAAESPCRMC
ncbi:hypothetical protein CC77DRAFT_1018992 [Alternaria alternata]|uniref:Uncharacterized protein n=1 Tax=Alternaria alternata TaxID=5599 RepID=A0A177DT91_ALTAL|nr:hypothetical protein CC77DRAFT_1018992 [Alternaria alternata]OAG21989.1 hypothetical protein CC77DRAFT_1018992 [Alternaria alternata]